VVPDEAVLALVHRGDVPPRAHHVGSVLIVNNRFTRWTIAAICLPGSSGKLRDNFSLASGAYADCIDAGNNN
jgi:hypothetical protein